MQPVLETFHFGSVSGSVFAFFFFLLIAGFIGFAIYALLAHPRFRRPEARAWGTAFRCTALTIGTATALAIFLTIYFTMLDGFYRLAVQRDRIQLTYILPSRTWTLRREEIAAVEKVYAYRLRWRLVLRTFTGVEYESTPSSSNSVDEALQRLKAFQSEQ